MDAVYDVPMCRTPQKMDQEALYDVPANREKFPPKTKSTDMLDMTQEIYDVPR